MLSRLFKLFRRRPPPKPKPSKAWGFTRFANKEVGATLYWSEGRVKHLQHLKLFRVVLRSRKATLLEHSPRVRSCLQFILESERRQAKNMAARRLFCDRPAFAIEVVAFDHQGLRIDLLTIGFCIEDSHVDCKILAINMARFLESQLENADWQYTSFLDHESLTSRILLMSALLASYFYGIHGANR